MPREKFVFRAIVRKNQAYPVNIADRLEASVSSAMLGSISRIIQRAMAKRVSNWDTKPGLRSDFSTRTRLGNLTGFSLKVTPTGKGADLWRFVTFGVKPHVIAPKASGRLLIRKGYKSRTKPGGFYGGPGTYGGPNYYAHTVVGHPGIEARYLEKDIVKEVSDEVLNLLEKAVQVAVSG